MEDAELIRNGERNGMSKVKKEAGKEREKDRQAQGDVYLKWKKKSIHIIRDKWLNLIFGFWMHLRIIEFNYEKEQVEEKETG